MVRVSGGAYRGYRGRVKQEMDNFVLVEFDATNKIHTIKKTEVRVEGLVPTAPPAGNMGQAQGLSGSGFGRHSSNPPAAFASGGGYAQTTRTPLHITQTPMHQQGSGAATPLHPSTHVPYTPMHPGSVANENQARGLAGAAAGAKPYVPSSSLVETTGRGGETPGSAMSHPEPPIDEGVLDHYEGVLVSIISGKESGKSALVKSVDAKKRKLVLQLGSVDPGTNAWIAESDAAETYSLSSIETLPPSKKDKVRLLKDSDLANAGTVGSLIGIDDADGIVKVEGSTELVVIDLKHLARVI